MRTHHIYANLRKLVSLLPLTVLGWGHLSCSNFKAYTLTGSNSEPIAGVYSGIAQPENGSDYRIIFHIAESGVVPRPREGPDHQWVFVKLEKYRETEQEGSPDVDLRLYVYRKNFIIKKIDSDEYRILIRTSRGTWKHAFQVDCRRLESKVQAGQIKKEVLAEVLKRPDVHLENSVVEKRQMRRGTNPFLRMPSWELEFIENDPDKFFQQDALTAVIRPGPTEPEGYGHQYGQDLNLLRKRLQAKRSIRLALFYPEFKDIKIIHNGIPWFNINIRWTHRPPGQQRFAITAQKTAAGKKYVADIARTERKRVKATSRERTKQREKRISEFALRMTASLAKHRPENENSGLIFVEPSIWGEIWGPFEEDRPSLFSKNVFETAAHIFPSLYRIFNGDCEAVPQPVHEFIFMAMIGSGYGNFDPIKIVAFEKKITIERTDGISGVTTTNSYNSTYAKVRVNERYHEAYRSHLKNDSKPSPYLYGESSRYNIIDHLIEGIDRRVQRAKYRGTSSFTTTQFARQLLENSFRCFTGLESLQAQKRGP